MTQADFYMKLSKFQEIISKQDWSPDGHNDKQDYDFVSHRKMKKNVGAAAIEAGLVWKITYDGLTIQEPIGMMKQHYIIVATGSLTDRDQPEFSIEYKAFGEAADSGDKALSKAQTSGFKAILNNNFFIADIDADGEETIANEDDIKAKSTSGYAAQQQIVKERVLKQLSDEVPKVPKVQTGGNISESQRKVMEKIIAKARIMSETELMAFGSKDQIEIDYSEVKDADQALKFISAYTGVLRCP